MTSQDGTETRRVSEDGRGLRTRENVSGVKQCKAPNMNQSGRPGETTGGRVLEDEQTRRFAFLVGATRSGVFAAIRPPLSKNSLPVHRMPSKKSQLLGQTFFPFSYSLRYTENIRGKKTFFQKM